MRPKTKSATELVMALRSQGMRYDKIAQLLGVKPGYCRTVYSRANQRSKKAEVKISPDRCHYCGEPLVHTPNAKRKFFCNDHCRTEYYNRKKAAILNARHCEICGKLFAYRGIYTKRFCSAECRTKGSRQVNGNR